LTSRYNKILKEVKNKNKKMVEKRTLIGVVDRISEKSGKRKNGSTWHKWSALILNLGTGETDWVSSFGEMPDKLTEAHNGKTENPPIEVSLEVEVEGDEGQYLTYVDKSCEIISGGGKTTEIDMRKKKSLKEATGIQEKEFTPASEIKPFKEFVGGEIHTILEIANESFKRVFERSPESEGDMAVINTMQIFMEHHWAVERWMRATGSKTIEQIYQEGIEKVQKNGT